jgi:hypothetical protein
MKRLILFLTFFLFFSIVAFSKDKPDTTSLSVKTWNYNEYGEIIESKIDTTLDYLQILSKPFVNDYSSTYLGRLGHPLKSNTFINQEYNTNFLFSTYVDPYVRTLYNNNFYNTNKPFTLLQYKTAGPTKNNEQALHLIHTQNITKDFNFGLDYNIYSAEDQYRYLKNKSHAFSFFTTYTGEKYNLNVCFNLNNQAYTETGGIVNDSAFNYKDKNYDGMEVFLKSAKSKVKNIGVGIIQEYKLPSISSFDSIDTDERYNSVVHLLTYQKYDRTYSDESTLDYYENSFFDNSKTTDEAESQVINNQLFLKLNRLFPYLKNNQIGIGHEYIKNNMFIPDSLNLNNSIIWNLNQRKNYQNLYSTISIKSDFTRLLYWQANGKYYLIGERGGNYDVEGRVSTKIGHSENAAITYVNCKAEKTILPYFYNYYYSNHFIWQNQSESYIRNTGTFGIDVPKVKLYTSFSVSQVNNYLYFNHSALPTRANSSIQVLTGTIWKKFKLWHFYSIQAFTWQKASNDTYIHLPEYIYYTSTYFDQEIHFFTGGKLQMQLGFDLTYHSAFYADAYMPSTGVFYIQNEKKSGDYPLADVFLKINVKSLSFFLKFAHANAGYSGPVNYNTLNYPMPERIFSYGISWVFDD